MDEMENRLARLDYIAKPLTGDVLKKKLRKHLKR